MPARSSGRAPYGFRWSAGELLVEEEKAAVRRIMFDLFLEHRTKGGVARVLNSMGYPSPSGGKWTDVTVARLLRCSSAIGEYSNERAAKDEGEEATQGVGAERRNVPCPPLVQRDVWDSAQSILSEQADGGIKIPSRSSHPLSGLVHCGCGETMTIPSGIRKFSCGKCGTKVPLEDLERIFLRDLGRFAEAHKEALSALLAADPKDDILHRELSGLRAEREGIEAELAKGQERVLSGEFSADRFSAFASPLESKLRSLRAKERAAKAKAAAAKSPASDRRAEKATDVSFVDDVWPRLPLKARQRIAQAFVGRFVASPGHVAIHHRFPLETATVAQHMDDPTDDPTPEPVPGEPVYIRLPKPGILCPLSGLTRAMLNELILPTPRNLHNPPVKSISQCQPGKQRGVRLIVWASLKSHLLGLQNDRKR